ncbi:MAG: HAD hydrolase-like protein [Nitriliruptorales bacterium]|nr:HAD hydrolase-like protein [Nitriliruptorales bacterium]
MRHVVWDWNGTLFDDSELVVAALNHTLSGYDVEPLTPARYRELYTRPVHRFYERVLGRTVDDAEWDRLNHDFHVAYAEQLDVAQLADEAQRALGLASIAACTQSLLSMYPHEQLLPLVRELELHHHFVRIDGLRGPAGGPKAPHLERHLLEMAAEVHVPMREVLVIGDALDDAVAAEHVGARCVLYEGGSHHRDELEAAGVPVATDLVAALELGGVTG